MEVSVATKFVDVDSGEMVRLLPLPDGHEDGKKKYVFQGGFVIMGALNITRLLKAKVGYNGLRLALLMVARMSPRTGLVHCSNQEYAQELEIRPEDVSRLIGKLAKVNFIHRTGTRLVTINPLWCFRGTATDQHAAIEAWGRLHPIGIVTPISDKVA